MAKKKHHEEEGGEAWLLPYSDLMTLLLAVFIVLFAVSQVDEVKSAEAAKVFKENLTSYSIFDGSPGILSNNGESVIDMDHTTDGASGQETEGQDSSGQKDNGQKEPGEAGISDKDKDKDKDKDGQGGDGLASDELANMQNVLQQIKQYLEDAGIGESVELRIDARGLVISWNSTILFDSGSADIKPVNLPDLERIAMLISDLDNYIRVEGHTDNVPIASVRYASNWELSCSRAASIVKLFINSGIDPQKLVAAGYGENKPEASNATPEGRARNRRIDIVILSERYNALETHMQDVSPTD